MELTSGSEDTKRLRYALSQLRPGARYIGIAWPENSLAPKKG